VLFKELSTFFCLFFLCLSFSCYGADVDEELIGDIRKIKKIDKDVVIGKKVNDKQSNLYSLFDDDYDEISNNINIKRKSSRKKTLSKKLDIKVIDANKTNSGIAIRSLKEAYTLFKQRDYELAILYYKKSLKDNPKSVEAKFGLAVSYQLLRQYDQAIDLYVNLLNNNYSRKKIVSNLLLCLKYKSYKDSLKILLSVDNKILGYSDILAQIGIIYMKINDNKKAISTLLEAHESAPTNAVIAYDLGILFDRDNNIDNAKYFFDIAIKNGISSVLEKQDEDRLAERVQELNEQIKNEIKKNKANK